MDAVDGEQDSQNDDKKQESTAPKKVTALVTLSHPDVAVKFVASFKEFSRRLDDRYNAMQAYMVPSSPDVPLPPPILDAEASNVLGEKLWNNFVSLEGADEPDGNARNKMGGYIHKLEEVDNGGETINGDHIDGEDIRIDVTKVAAAAGGAFDPDEDPLSAPHVLEAVKAFRRKLAETQTTDQKRRIEIVARKLDEMRPKIQAIVKQEKLQQRQPQPPPLPPGGLPLPNMDPSSAPPPPVGLPPPPPTGLPPPLSNSAPGGDGDSRSDSGKRGRSNLPAWMTAQQQAASETESRDPPSKKQKTGVKYPTNFPPTLPQSTHAPLKQFLTKKVEESLGEADNTLIDFLYGHILGGKETSQLLEEIQVVLEEEAYEFLDAVWAKVHELHP